MRLAVLFLFTVFQLHSFWRGFSPDENFDFFLIDDFEEKIVWQVKTKQGFQSYGKIISNEPLFPATKNDNRKKMQELFLADVDFVKKSAKLYKRADVAKPKYSLEVQCFFYNPGFDFVDIEPNTNLQTTDIHGQPRLLSLWIYGYNKRHTLYANFSNSSGRQFSIKITKLNFFGWERIEVVLPTFIQKRNKKNANKFDFNFLGFRIKSQRNEEPGLFLFTFDNVIILTDISSEKYPGSKISDKWR